MEIAFYEELVKDFPIVIKYIDEQKGKGVFAKQDIEEGDVIIKESPIVACQYSYNKVYFPACSHCLKSMETPNEMLQRLANLDTKPKLFNTNEEEIPKIYCPHCETEFYCSEECRDEAWGSYHKILCLGKKPKNNHPLIKLEEAWKQAHFPPETATIMLLARMIAMIKIFHEKNPSEKKDLLGPFSKFISEYENRDIDAVHQFLAQKFKDRIDELHDLTKKALCNKKDEGKMGSLFTSKGFKSLFCLMCLNAQGIGTSSLEIYERELEDLKPKTKQSKQAQKFIENLEDNIEEVSGDFTHCEGSGLYLLHSCLNHSCEPNAICVFPHNSSVVEVTACRDIKAGEEINLCYLDDAEEDFESRQDTLKAFYLFKCACERCKTEAQKQSQKSKPASKKRKLNH